MGPRALAAKAATHVNICNKGDIDVSVVVVDFAPRKPHLDAYYDLPIRKCWGMGDQDLAIAVGFVNTDGGYLLPAPPKLVIGDI